MIGDWMGTQYGAGGERYDYRLFLDHDGRFEQTIRSTYSTSQREEWYAGRWRYEESEGILRLDIDQPERNQTSWWILAVHKCEESNCIMVLRAAILASRNLPILFYRVHCDKRGYGTGWEEQLTAAYKAASET